jgi:hypothetical protein
MKCLLGDNAPHGKRFTARLLWEPRDLWVGIFWTHTQLGDWAEEDKYLLVYVSIIPCLPVCFCLMVNRRVLP